MWGCQQLFQEVLKRFVLFIITCFANPILYFCNAVILSCLPVLHQLSHFGKQNGAAITLHTLIPVVLGSNFGRETSYPG
jgi:hypothetical protein